MIILIPDKQYKKLFLTADTTWRFKTTLSFKKGIVRNYNTTTQSLSDFQFIKKYNAEKKTWIWSEVEAESSINSNEMTRLKSFRR